MCVEKLSLQSEILKNFMKNTKLIGSFLVLLGAICYGLLATVVKLAYQENYTRSEVLFSQIGIGLLVLFLLSGFFSSKQTEKKRESKGEKLKLILAGTSLGFTSLFYYTSIQYISVTVGIVLLMQSIWMGVILDLIFNKQKPSKGKLLAVLIILAGTVLATDALNDAQPISFVGILWGLLAAFSYSITIFSNHRISVRRHPIHRSLWMLVGGFCVVTVVCFPDIISNFNWSIFKGYGLFLALFGTILPPILFAYGMPKINLGLGSILSSIEIPVSVGMAAFFLNEKANATQWIGIVCIVATIIVLNYPRKKAN